MSVANAAAFLAGGEPGDVLVAGAALLALSFLAGAAFFAAAVFFAGAAFFAGGAFFARAAFFAVAAFLAAAVFLAGAAFFAVAVFLADAAFFAGVAVFADAAFGAADLSDPPPRRVAFPTACFTALIADVLLAAIRWPLRRLTSALAAQWVARVPREHGAERIGGYRPCFKQPRGTESVDARGAPRRRTPKPG
jgi:hypothetical protein